MQHKVEVAVLWVLNIATWTMLAAVFVVTVGIIISEHVSPAL